MTIKNFLFSMSANLKEAIRDRARSENRSQADLVREAIVRHLQTPLRKNNIQTSKIGRF